MNIKKLRTKMGISQLDLAKKLGVPPSTLFNYETGRAEPNISMLIKLADFYNVSIDEIVGRETDIINLKFLDDNQAFLIKKIIKMNELQLMRAKAYVSGLTED